MSLTSRLLLAVGLLAAVVGGKAADAYGCVPQPFILVRPQASAAAGTEVKVDGQLFPNGSRIEIRWNATDGPLLATTQSADFSVPITIPSAPAGLYTVLALSRSQSGVQGEVARAGFQVTGAAPAPPPAASPPEARPEPPSSGGGTSFASVAAAVGLVALGLVAGALLFGRRSKHATGSPTPTTTGSGDHQPPTG